MLQISNLTKKFGSISVLKGINLDVNEGEVVSIIGPSGTGKSTLLRCINYLEEPTSGSITIDKLCITPENQTKRKLYEFRRKTAMIFQDHSLFENKTVLENITLPLTVACGFSKADAKEKAMVILKSIGLEKECNQYPCTLSGGQQQRVGIGRAIAIEPKVMLFDEPTSALDPSLINEVLELIRSLAERHFTMIIVTHEMNFARQVSDKVIFLNHGVIVESGTPEQIFLNPQCEETGMFINSFLKRNNF